ncbi:sulfotransferase family protein [Rhodohalobacter sp.]|uniref:sulfotransferase family protein n=1 Tax=Rhodohalobacter sp. TaxID=1974210 RepID=UPI002ACE2E21|nr:sulfotransferase [Rhodohalobacter sp.]MDZ7755181.1 sulfotransferase [Rhodohalobacter sp.]
MVEPLFKRDIETPINMAGNFDAVQDVPWAALFKELDAAYPGSKFILTVRDEESWLNSAKKHFGETHVGLHEWLYGDGVLKGNEELYLKRFREHYRDVQAYFEGREQDLLVMDLIGGDKWEKLCPFLEEPIPDKASPTKIKGNTVIAERIK